jgi:hypothetical protein
MGIGAASVFSEIRTRVRISDLIQRTRHLTEIHAAPKWLWRALVAATLTNGWHVEQTKSAVRRVKDAAESLEYLDIAKAVVSGRMLGWSRARRSRGPSGCRTDTHAAPRAAASCI